MAGGGVAEPKCRRRVCVPASVSDSRVRVHDLDRDIDFVCSIVYPAEANADQKRISVLAPLGTALLGYSEGQVVSFPAPGGQRRVKIKEVEYQPEAAARKSLAA